MRLAIPTLVDAISELQNPTSASRQVIALKHLKNEVIGHSEKKEALVQHGAIDALVNTLNTSAKARGKRRTVESNGTVDNQVKSSSWGDEDEIRLQALLLLGCLANGGPAFVPPLLAASTVPVLIDNLNLKENPTKIVLAAIRALTTLVATCQLVSLPGDPLSPSAPAVEQLYSRATISVFADILFQRSSSHAVQDMIIAVCQIIRNTCTTDAQRDALLDGAVLDLLGARLASYHVQNKIWSPQANPAVMAVLPPPPSKRLVPHLFGAINCIVTNSRYRVARLLYSPVIVSVFPLHKPSPQLEPSVQYSPYAIGREANPGDYWLPKVPPTPVKSDGKGENGYTDAFPALASAQPKPKGFSLSEFSERPTNFSDLASAGPAPESLLVPWLFYLIRTEHSICRIEAAYLLTSIARGGFSAKVRERGLALLVIPVLSGLLDETTSPKTSSVKSTNLQSDESEAQERAATVLAELLRESPPLQRAAIESSVLKNACSMLKQTFEPIDPKPPTWSPDASAFVPSADAPASCQVGSNGLRPDLHQLFKRREAALKLIAALAEKEDKHRKSLIESGISNVIIDSLTPFKDEMLAELNSRTNKEKFLPGSLGNIVPVLKAACMAARALARSVSLLRTSLIDAGMAKPTFALLKHSNVDVLIEATNVICNIITDVSPMREQLVESGVIKTLCEHAHSADSRIRLVSLWALKHLAFHAPNDVKTACFEELGTGWLVQIITGGTAESMTGRSKLSSQLSMGAANAAGERVDILNAMDEAMDTEDLQDQNATLENTSGHSTLFAQELDMGPSRAAYLSRLKEIKDLEEAAAAREAQSSDLQIQCQGLDFMRNLITGHGAPEMIENIFSSLTAARVFEIITTKLKPVPQPGSGDSSIPQPPEILTSAVFLVVHIAAGNPRHRQQLMSQPELLKALLPLLKHTESGIRLSTLWVVNNLTWVDDQTDAPNARHRASELKTMGFDAALRELLQDKVLDVRERASTGVEQIRELLGGEPASASRK